MNTCIQCGSQLIERASFCQTCGRPVEVAQQDQAAYQPVSPAGYPPVSPAAYPAGYGQPQPGPYLVGGTAPARYPGDWAGAIIAVTSGVLVALGTALVALLIILSALPDGASGPSPSQMTGATALYTALSFGGSIKASATSGFGTETASVSYQFLGPAVLAFALIGLIYVRRLRRKGTPTFRAAAAQAGRCAVVMAVELVGIFLLTMVGTSTAESSEHADIVTTLVFGLVSLAVTLTIAGFLGLSGILPAQVERVRAVIAGPLRGVIVMFLVANVLALIGVLVLVGHNISGVSDAESGNAWRSIALLLILALPNMTTIALLLGMGVPISANIGGSLTDLDGSSNSPSYSILDLTRHNQLFWLWPLVVALLLLLAGAIAGRRSPYTANGRSMAPMLGVVLPLVLLAFALASSGDVSGETSSPVAGHLNVGLTLGFGVLWGLVFGFIGMAFAARRPAAPQFYAPPAQAFAAPVPGGYPAPPGAGQPPAPGQPGTPQAETYPAGYMPPGYAPPGYATPGYPPPTVVEQPQQPWQEYPRS